ncbi:MmyB family transcriptional regulator [Catellatospora paridis]|uniref:MmyB family transcriptional regulator n=1 Tax=Catellatospora paridis TaxID=1617086 RepID=UPI0022A9EF54|nr:hypothetical protein [Catellatospora paridis]
MLAGVNSDHCARPEQGRERSPSPQILEAIRGALWLDDQAREHLYRLAAPDVRKTPRETVSGPLQQLLDGHTTAPASVLNPAKNFMAFNALAEVLFSPCEVVDNLARITFLDPAGPAVLHPMEQLRRDDRRRPAPRQWP